MQEFAFTTKNVIIPIAINIDSTDIFVASKTLYIIPRCKELRSEQGLSINKLAGLSNVYSATISKIERRIGVTENSANKVFYALKKMCPELNIYDEVKTSLI